MSDNKYQENASVLIVIVNYRTPELTIACLESLTTEIESCPNLQVVVTDNNSGDRSVELISEAIAKKQWHWATLMPLNVNGGFAAGNNAAIRPALNSEEPPDYILLLNPDTVVRPGGAIELLKFMHHNPQVGIAGSRLENPDGSPQRSAFRFHSILSEINSGLRLGIISRLLSSWVVAPPVPKNACQVDWVAGASMLIRREVFDRVGLMDEAYFLYYEEVDFCLQANRAGYSCCYVPASRVVHLVGQSSGIDSAKTKKNRLPRYWFESRQRYFLKNHGWLYTVAVDLVWTICHSLWRLRRVLQNKPNTDPPKLLEDFVRHSSWFKLSRFKLN
ncbi:MAG: glycosyltransferase family 2 protein [Cyanobacteria bacterium J06623_7]